jgi:hypothetical protein
LSRRPTTTDRVRAKQCAIAEAPHRELDKQLDQAVEVDDDRDRRERDDPEQLAGTWSDFGPERVA